MTTTAPKAPFSMLNPFLPLPEVHSKNPFATVDPREVPADAPEGSYTYALVQSAPAVPAEECEVDAAAVEIVIRWGATTLHVAHLTPPRSFLVGEASDAAAVDFQLPAEKLGVACLPVVRKVADGTARVVIPAGAKGTATIGGQVGEDLGPRGAGRGVGGDRRRARAAAARRAPRCASRSAGSSWMSRA